MKTHASVMKGKATSRVGNQQAVFELKQRVVLALNKLADRDTYQLGVEELEKTIECLTPDGFAPFLSCILDTDSEKKSAVRKECIRLMGTLATFHEGLVGPHLAKMVASIVKRLKDSDSVVRDACVETVGILASKLSSSRIETDGLFIVLVRPLFEALGEQNKHVQSGSALCLSRVIDNIHDPPASVMQKMLARTVKLLKNPHFMAKPAVIELNRSIILAGGAPTHSSLTAALTGIQESLKNSDWVTRKAACAALGDIASCGAACLGSYRISSIRSLESCRFDKVKPVRDVALQTLQLWKNLPGPGPGTPEPSEAGSSVKETSYRDDYGDVTCSIDSTLKDNTLMKFDSELAKKRVPLSSRKAGRTYIEKSPQSGTNEWQIEIAIPRNRNISVAENQNDESEGSSVTKRCERINSDVKSISNIGYEYVEVDDKQECSSVSNLFTESIKSELVKDHCDAFDDANLVKSTGTSQRFAADEVSIEERRYLAKVHDRRSLDSTVTESTSQIMPGCCSQTEKEMVLIRKHLLEIENKQSNLMDMLKAFTTSITDSVSMVQSKVSNLEIVVGKMAQELVHGGRYSDVLATKVLKGSPTTASPRLSTCTPRPSVDSNKQPPLLPTKHAGVWENTISRSRSNSLGKKNSDMWNDATLKPSKSSLGKGTSTSFYREIHEDLMRQNGVRDPGPPSKARVNKLDTKSRPLKVMNDYFCEGDLDSEYAEALCSRNELHLFELLERTGPVLENLSQKTASDLLSTLASYLLEQRFVNSIVPWLQQLVDLINIRGPTYVVLATKAKRDLLYAIQEAAKFDVFGPAERKFFIEISKALHQFWGNGSY
ncbi:TORTIFOLIA1-like protein 2 [Sesamum alatum]|uniref:TORTIFOLIA1-like protein 2 n=1 Tax=Sesamum alatum TaxID=300844 RepID=A0AAE1XN41_9LAMI|nr:TORTIFOLIA1-like protein 2 [Sesamum alatum]